MAAPAEASAAPPKIAAAFTVDGDGDGRVDGVDVRFSATVKGTPRAGAFAVKGMRVLRAGKARGRQVALVVAEGTECDAGGKPTVSFAGRGLAYGRGRAVGRSRVDMERRDRGAPRMVCSVTEDSDRNGRVDGVAVTYSKSVRVRNRQSAPFLFAVSDYTVRSVAKSGGRTVRLRVSERQAFDTDATPAVTYRRPARRSERPYAVRSAGREAFPGAFKATRDRVAPILQQARTADVDADGLLDALTVTFSEPVEAGDGRLAVTGATVTDSSSAARGVVTLKVAEGPLGTGARPQVVQRGVTDAAGNAAAAGATTPADGAAPILTASQTGDVGGAAGRLDTLRVTFSEPVTGGAATGGGTPFGVTGYAVASVLAASGQDVEVKLSEGPAPDTGGRPPVGYTRGAGAAVRDLGGNEAASGVLAGTTDGVAPRLLSARTRDEDGNGKLDRLRFTFSEPVAHEAKAGPGGFSATALTSLAALAASGSDVDLTLVELLPNTGVTGPAAYAPTGAGDVRDAAGNLAPAAAVLSATDGARPVALAAATADAGGSGDRIDRVLLTLSEPVTAAADGAPPFSLTASGYTVAAVGAASGAQVAVDLVEAAGPDTGSAPAVGYTGQGDKLLDAGGLEPAVRDYPGLTTDSVAPRLVGVETRDGDADGRLDAVDLRYSEQVQGSPATAPFTISLPSRPVQSVSYAGAAVRLAVTEAGAPDTDQRPTVAYLPGDVADLAEGPADTADPAPALVPQQAADAAGPVVVSAATLDGDGDGVIDSVKASFSEALQHPADSGAPFALRVSDRTESSVSSPLGAGDNELTVNVTEAATPDGGFEPVLSVVSVPQQAERIRDLASPANDAPATSFSGTTDGVRPRLLSAQMGEAVGGECKRTPDPGTNGVIDCVRLQFSEPVTHPLDQDGSYPIALDGGYSITAAGVPESSPAVDILDVPLQEGATADRDRTAQVTYSDTVDEPVRDAAGNEGLPASSIAADRACADVVNEADSDSRSAGNPTAPVASSSLERRCAFDDDYFKVTAASDGVVAALVRPGPALASEVEVLNAAGATVGAPADPNAAGEIDVVTVTGLTAGTDYWVRVSGADAPTPQEGAYCLSVSVIAAQAPNCGPNEGELIISEVGMDGAAGAKFAELKNVSDFPLDSSLVQLDLKVGANTCAVVEPAGAGAIIEPGEYVVVTDDTGPGPFTCAEVGALAAAGNALQLESGGSRIDAVDMSGILTSGLATGHSLGLRTDRESASGNDDVATAWCRTYGADTKGAVGDGCDEYRLNEALLNPASAGADGIQGRAFLELHGNLPAKPASGLLAGWVVRGVNGETGEGTADFALPAGASPRENGTYVLADGVDAASPQRANVTTYDVIWDDLDLGDFSWPDLLGSPDPGPRGLQLLRPSPPLTPPCGAALADAMGWRQTSELFTRPADLLRQCASIEGGTPVGTIPTGSTASRLNLPSAGATSYLTTGDTGQNGTDFCRRGAPSPAQLNFGPCS